MPPRSRRRDVKDVQPLDTDVLDASPSARTVKKRKVGTIVSALTCLGALLLSGLNASSRLCVS